MKMVLSSIGERFHCWTNETYLNPVDRTTEYTYEIPGVVNTERHHVLKSLLICGLLSQVKSVINFISDFFLLKKNKN